MKYTLTILSLILLSVSLCQAQSIYSSDVGVDVLADTGYVPAPALVEKMNPKINLLIPIAESIGLNLALASFNSYIMDSEFAKISFKSIEHNFERGFSTDADGFLTNMFAHPFHGSIYFNLARSSGYNYYASLGVAAIGSWQWEFFMEIEPPAFNDWIMTSVGGSMLGEMFYRFSNNILDESLGGSARFWNELAAGIFNPGRLFNRLIYGRTARQTKEKLYKKEPMYAEIAFGANNVADGTNFKDGQKNGMLTLDYVYGTLFYKRTLKPFDHFQFYSAFNFGGVQPLIGQFRIVSTLWGKNKPVGEGSRFNWGFFQHYDYLNNNIYEVGGTSVMIGAGYRSPQKDKVQFLGLIHAGALLMGGANSDYSEYFKVEFLDSGRTYNMGPGAAVNMRLLLRFPFGSLDIRYNFWWIHTWDGAPGDEFIGMWQPALRIKLWKHWYLGLEYLLYHRHGRYEYFPNQNVYNNEQRLFVGFHF